MRGLIQPALFIVARTGVFLAVVAWIVGQWWNVVASCNVAGRLCLLSFGPYGGVLGCSSMAGTSRLVLTQGYESATHFPFDLRDLRIAQQAGHIADIYSCPGVKISTYATHAGGFTAVSHWLIVIAMISLNVMLMYWFRKHQNPD